MCGSLCDGEMNDTIFNGSSVAIIGNKMSVDSKSSYVMWPSGNVFVIVATLLYSFIFIAGIIGNSFIIITVLRWKEMRTPCNLPSPI